MGAAMRIRRGHGLNGGALAAFVAAIAMLLLSVGTAILEHDHDRAEQDRALAHEAAEQTKVIEDYFERARTITLITAQNPAFAEFYERPGTREEKIRAHIAPVREAEAALAYLQRL